MPETHFSALCFKGQDIRCFLFPILHGNGFFSILRKVYFVLNESNTSLDGFLCSQQIACSPSINLAPKRKFITTRTRNLTGVLKFIMNKFTAKHNLEEAATPITFLAGEIGKKIDRWRGKGLVNMYSERKALEHLHNGERRRFPLKAKI